MRVEIHAKFGNRAIVRAAKVKDEYFFFESFKHSRCVAAKLTSMHHHRQCKRPLEYPPHLCFRAMTSPGSADLLSQFPTVTDSNRVTIKRKHCLWFPVHSPILLPRELCRKASSMLLQAVYVGKSATSSTRTLRAKQFGTTHFNNRAPPIQVRKKVRGELIVLCHPWHHYRAHVEAQFLIAPGATWRTHGQVPRSHHAV